jgi:arylsulfatase A-like enzyme
MKRQEPACVAEQRAPTSAPRPSVEGAGAPGPGLARGKIGLLRRTPRWTGSCAAWSLGLLALVASGCGSEPAPEPGVQRLAVGFVPSDEGLPLALGRAAAIPGEDSLAAGTEIALVETGGSEDPAGVWVEAVLAPGAWFDAGDGYWIADSPLSNEAFGYQDELAQRLRAGEREFQRYKPTAGQPPAPPQGHFGAFQGRIYLRLGPAGRPPDGMRFALRMPRGVEDPSGAWRIELGRHCGEGWPLIPGRPEGVEIEIPQACRLLFRSAAIALRGRYPVPHPDPELHGRSRGLGPELGRVLFEVRLDGEMLARFEEPLTTEGSATPRAVELPARPGTSARLEIAVSGAPAWCAALAPRLAPAALPKARRPNVLVVLADTFRADNLSAYGSTLGLTPSLDRWAQRSLLYERAWTPGGWTLPSQASLMTSLWPLQHRALTAEQAIPAAARTLAEELASRGYRTGAVTDGGVVSRRHDFEQGFESFEERFRPLEDLLDAAQAFLAEDDGRPTFLYLHSYRVHHPYYASAETLARHGERLGAAEDYARAEAALRATGWWNHRGPLPDGLRPAMRRLEGLYRAGVIDFDAGLGAFLDRLEDSGWFDPGYLVFTSDHGEAFGEHDNFRHEGGVFEEQSRIPLFLVGPGIDPKRSEQPASLIDIAPTVMELLRLPAVLDWRGRSLLGAGPGARSLLCVAGGDRPERPLAVIQSGQHKLLVPELDQRPAALQAAFDLGRDPAERKNRWPEQHDAVQGLFPRLERDLKQFNDEALEETRAFGGGMEHVLNVLGYLSPAPEVAAPAPNGSAAGADAPPDGTKPPAEPAGTTQPATGDSVPANPESGAAAGGAEAPGDEAELPPSEVPPPEAPPAAPPESPPESPTQPPS